MRIIITTILLFFFLSANTFAVDSSEVVSVSVGAPQIEYSTVALPHTFVSADIKKRNIKTKIYNEYHNLQTYKTDHKLFRVHLPLKITPRRSGVSDVISILYSFSYKYELFKIIEDKKEHIEKFLSFPVKIEKIPLKDSGTTEWILTSDWMVKSDRKYWDPHKGGFAIKENGKYELVKEAKKNYSFFVPISKFYFPFEISYWSENSLEEKWPEVDFPEFFVRKIEGNETYAGCSFQIFTGGLSEPAIGNISLPDLHSFVKQITNNWKNIYSKNSVYSNCWERKSWALKFRKIAGIKLKTAFLARVCLTNPEDSDAADLLLQILAAQKENEKARQVYLRCKRSWPDFSEYWFKQYFNSLEKGITKRAAIMAFKREHPDSGFAIGTLVDLLIKSERWSSANSQQKLWAKKEPSNIFVYSAAVKLAQSEKNSEAEKKALCKIIQLSMDRSKLNISPYAGTKIHDLYLTALNLQKSKKHNIALLTLRKALELNTNFAPIHVTMGKIYADLKVYGSAKKQFETALAIEPENPAALAGLIRYSKVSGKYQKKLWSILKPEIIKQKNKGNWTNALNLAKFEFQLLENVNKLYIDVAVSYIESLIQLKQYESASELLYNISVKKPNNPKLNFLWGEFSKTLAEDPRFLLLEKRPFELRKKAIAAFKKVIKDAPKSKRAYAQLAILYVEDGKLSKAYEALEKCYRLAPSKDLALWIADICLLKSLKNSKEVIPGSSSKTFFETAKDFYKKVALAKNSPAAQLGLIRSNRIFKKDKNNTPLIRQSLNLFPESPEILAEKIKLYVDSETTAPVLWMPYTNMLKKLRPFHYDISTTLAALFKQRQLKFNEFNCLTNLAFSILKWDSIYFSDILNIFEFQQSPNLYSLGKNIGFKFHLKKHLFLNPVLAYPWFAIRSKYTENDLRLGKTKWWKRHLFVKSAYKFLKKAAKIDGSAKIYISLLVKEFDKILFIGEDRKLRAYGSLLRNCFYVDQPECNKKPRSLRAIYSRKKLEDSGIIGDYSTFLKSIFTPLIIRDRWALPPALRETYLPSFALKNIFYQDYKNNFSPIWKYFSLKNSSENSVNWPLNSTNIIWWTANISSQPIMDYSISKNKVSIYQTKDNPTATSSWKGVGGTMLTKDKTFPYLESFFDKSVSGIVQNISIAGAKIDKKYPPEFSLIFSPAPMDCPVEKWYDEALVLQLSWPNHTNPVLKVFAKVYSKEKGMLPGSPGIKLGEFFSDIFTNIYWELSKDKIMVSSGISNNKNNFIKVNHKLSSFAWSHGFYLNLQFKACEKSVSYSLEKIILEGK